jgi:hypothetical protein
LLISILGGLKKKIIIYSCKIENKLLPLRKNTNMNKSTKTDKKSIAAKSKKPTPKMKKKVSVLLNPRNSELLARLEKFVVDKKGYSLGKLAASIGVAKTFFNTCKSQNSAIGSDTLMKILKYYPELSADWLLRGTGAMLVGAKNEKDVDYRFKMERLIARFDIVVGGLSDSRNAANSILQDMKRVQKGKGI